MGLTFSPDPPHLLAGAGTAAEQAARPRMYADGSGIGWAAVPAQPAIGAIQGSPGYFYHPAGNAITPADEAELHANVTSDPQAWWGDSWVVLKDGTRHYWTATEWRPGVAPWPAKNPAVPYSLYPAEPTITASDATNAAKLAGLGFVAAPQTAWTLMQYIAIDPAALYAFHWNGTAWTAGQAP